MKPVLLTTRDAAIISAIAAVAAVVILYATNLWHSTSGTTSDYLAAAAGAFSTSFLAQYIAEYSGLNGALAKESIEWARGNALAGYKSRRMAQLAEQYYKELARPENLSSEARRAAIDKNYEHLHALLENPALSSWVSRRVESGAGREQILEEAARTFRSTENARRDTEILLGLTPRERELAISLAAKSTPEDLRAALAGGLDSLAITRAWTRNIGLVPGLAIVAPEENKK